jgi:MoxR-like ATPase
MFDSIEEVQRAMERDRYICDRGLATVLYLALKLEKPVLIEGGADVGKTGVAKVMAQILAYTGAT